jgi:hypothetical protein
VAIIDSAATSVQKCFRGFFAATKRSVLVLHAAVRGYLVRMEFKRMREMQAALTVQVRAKWTTMSFVLSTAELTTRSPLPPPPRSGTGVATRPGRAAGRSTALSCLSSPCGAAAWPDAATSTSIGEGRVEIHEHLLSGLSSPV